MDKFKTSLWRAYLSIDDQYRHHDWIDAGRKGSGRIDIEGKDLRGARIGATRISYARFIRCDLRESQIYSADLRNTEIVECNCENSNLGGIHLNDGVIKNCNFKNCNAKGFDCPNARITGCDWSQSDLERSRWEYATVKDTCFKGVNLFGAKFINADFINCDFLNCDLTFVCAQGAVFKHCNFREADLESMDIENTVFSQCGFYNCENGNLLELLGSLKIEQPDFSENFDGSKIISDAELYESWGLQMPEKPSLVFASKGLKIKH